MLDTDESAYYISQHQQQGVCTTHLPSKGFQFFLEASERTVRQIPAETGDPHEHH